MKCKKLGIYLAMAAMLTLTACGKTEEVSNEQDAALQAAEAQTEETGEDTDVEDNVTQEAPIEVTITEEPAETETEPEMEESADEQTADSDSTEGETTDSETSVSESTDWIADLSLASQTSQIIAVTVENGAATLSFHEKDSAGTWTEELSCDASIGKNGLGKTAEGDKKTPVGIYHILRAFGNKADPGCALGYTQVDDSYYWVDDGNSAYYNQFVTTNQVACDWTSAEHIAAVGSSYNYVLATDYNSSCTPGKGSAIFIHCKPTGGAGCVAIDESNMKYLMTKVTSGCAIVIDYKDNMNKY